MADKTLVGYLDTLADQKLASVGSERTLRKRVHRALWAELSERSPALGDVARSLGVSARTLQRQLRQEGTTFAKLLAELRREMAPTLLRDGRHGVSEVAFLLGYRIRARSGARSSGGSDAHRARSAAPPSRRGVLRPLRCRRQPETCRPSPRCGIGVLVSIYEESMTGKA